MNIIPCFLGVVVLFCVVSFESVDGISFISIPNFDTNLRVQSNPFLKWWNLLNRRTTPKPYTSVKSCPACTCGKPNINRRIVGGQETQKNQYPWVGMLYHSNRYYCGLSLINDRYALTACHCVNGFRRESMTVRFLQHNRNIKDSEIIERLISKVIQHPNYVARTFESDIALLRLSSPIIFNELIHPVCLPEANESFIGQNGIVMGWGALSEIGPVANTLQEVLVPIIDNAQCKRYFPFEVISSNMFCAGYKMGLKDACQGDSGGPLHVVNNGQYQIAGLVSWGDGCARPNKPGVYTKVNNFLPWIKSYTTDACYC